MSRAKLTVVLVFAIAAGAVGALVVHAEFVGNAGVVKSETAGTAPSSGWLEQHVRAANQAAHRSATEDMTEDCAALRKMGASNPNCPPQ